MEPVSRRWGTFRWPIAAEWLALLASPVAAFWLFGVEPFFRQNGVDPFIYIGYAWDGQDLWARYGPTYYAVRFALLLPIRLTTALFGVEGGYFVLRYLLAVAAAVALYLPLRKLAGRSAGWLGVVLVLWSPIFLRALMTTYADTTGLPATMVLIAALLLALGRSKGRVPAMIVAGLAYGVAIHSNPILVIVAGFVFVPWTIAEIRRRRVRILADGAIVVAAVAAVTVVGVVYYRTRFGDADIFTPSIDAARSLSGANGKLFRAPDNAWLSYRFHLYLTPLVLISWLITRWRRWRGISPIEWVTVGTLALMGGFFVVHQFLLGSSTLETYYYTSYLAAPLLLSVVVVIAAIAERVSRGHLVLWGAVGVAVIVPLVRNAWLRDLQFALVPTVPVIGAVVFATVVFARRPFRERDGTAVSGVAVAAVVITVALLQLAAPFSPPLSRHQKFRYDPYYHLAIGNRDDSGLDWYELTFDMIDRTPPLAAPGQHVLFWYADGPPMLNAIQSAYLWRTTAWQSTFPGMPLIDAWRIARLRDEQVGFLVLLGETPEQIDGGVAALRGAGIGVDWQKRSTLTEDRSTLYMDVVRITVPSA